MLKEDTSEAITEGSGLYCPGCRKPALPCRSCTSGGGEAAGGSGDSDSIITVNATEPQKGLIPADTTEVGGGKVVDALWEGLVYYDVDGATQMGVAESIESDNGTTWTVKLRDDAVFSDGTPVLAKKLC